ncbi:MAG: beta-galactosidase [Armatimonadetes bacterium]|nr:beta-galactosidase [Armatimonadota bacterium]
MRVLLPFLCLAAAASAEVELSAKLAGLPDTWRVAGDWLPLSGEWSNAATGFAAGPGTGLALLDSCPELSSGTVSVTLTPGRRLRGESWSYAGLALVESPARYWVLLLVEDPDGATRRMELVENYDALWQAQREGAAKLPAKAEGDGTWEPGRPYRLELSWSAERVAARAKPAAAAAWQWQGDCTLTPGAAAVRSGRPGFRTNDLAATYRDLAVKGEAATVAALGSQAVVIGGGGPWEDRPWKLGAEQMGKLAGEAGYQVATVAPEQLAAALSGGKAGLLIAPSLEMLPEPAARALADYLRAGGRLLASGGEAFRQVLFADENGAWVPREQLFRSVHGGRVIVEPATAHGLERGTNQPEPAPAVSPGVNGPGGLPNALEVQVPKLTGWDTLAVNSFDEPPFREGESLTLVTVRGTKGQRITVEWIEADKSRWIAQVPLADSWQTHVLEPGQFVFWPDGSPPAREGTSFQPRNARRLSFGPATGLGAQPGEVEYTIAPIAVAAAPPAARPFTAPDIETVSPWYKQYPVQRDGVTVRVPVARGRGTTSAPEVDGRYSVVGPLLEPLATRYVRPDGGAVVWLPAPVLAGKARGELVELLRRTGRGIVLLNGGARDVVALPAEPLFLAARVCSHAATAAEVQVQWTVRQGDRVALERSASRQLWPGATIGLSASYPAGLVAGEYQVETLVSVGGKPVDQVIGSLRVMPPAAESGRGDRRVRVADGHFVVGGRRVFLHGVNYWPRYVAGQGQGRYWGHWLAPADYDPDLVEADLAGLQQLGMNLVSISCGQASMARPLMDFLERCRRHNIWVNLYHGGAQSLEYRPEAMAEFYRAAHLAGNDTLFAYDLNWEPHFGPQAERRRWDGEWRRWVDDQYGSLKEAEAAWGVPGPVDDKGRLTNPPDDQLGGDGPHRVMVAAYRRFADDLVSRHYGLCARMLRKLDPDTLLGTRTGYGGTGQPWPSRVLAFDLCSGAAHLDFTSPEGYGLPPSFEEGRKTGFITTYSRYAGNGKPVFWAEFGASVGAHLGTTDTRDNQRKIWEAMLQVAGDSGADASAGWWFPGGWRLDEKSDYGVFDPDGTPRDSVVAGAELGRKFNNSPPDGGRGEPVVISIDRDADARGISALWPAHADEYVAARRAGRPVKLVTPGTGTTTTDMPLVQVGNVPYAGAAPLKYANAEVVGLRVVWPGGERGADNGADLAVPHQTAFEVYVTLLNTGDATWLPGANPAAQGGCRVKLDVDEALLPAEVLRFGTVEVGPLRINLYDKPRNIEGRLTIDGVGPCGEVIRLHLAPQ